MTRRVVKGVAAALAIIASYRIGWEAGRAHGIVEGTGKRIARELGHLVDLNRAWRQRLATMSYRELRYWRKHPPATGSSESR